ncbi:MAG TPA: hypothetical protein VJ739_05535 [Gemmataceae bacterium]|nr:hypothetical protein [Gemmataceae bacterium]
MSIPLSDWLPPLLVGVVFTAFAAFKFYGLARGVVGGARKPFAQKLCGT